MQWKQQEEDYLRILEERCTSLSQDYHKVYFSLQSYQSRLRIPAIVIGSFTGVASFGTSTFPTQYHPMISIIVGIVNVCIAILNTIESYYKLGENINLSSSASVQLRQLANDINKELAIDMNVRETSGINYLRDCYTRYQQITSSAPILKQFSAYKVEPLSNQNSSRRGLFKSVVNLLTSQNASPNASMRTSLDEKGRELRNHLHSIKLYTRKANLYNPAKATTNSGKKNNMNDMHTINIEDIEEDEC